MGKRVRVMHRATSESLAKKQKEQMFVDRPSHSHSDCIMDSKYKGELVLMKDIKIWINVNLSVTLLFILPWIVSILVLGLWFRNTRGNETVISGDVNITMQDFKVENYFNK